MANKLNEDLCALSTSHLIITTLNRYLLAMHENNDLHSTVRAIVLKLSGLTWFKMPQM